MAFGIAEQELRSFPIRDMVGDYAAWTYFQSLDRSENQELVSKFKATYGSDRVTSDAITMAYSSVRLWAQTVEEAQSADPVTVRKLIGHESLNAPGGIISIDPETQHTWRPVYIGQIRADGQFDITWSSDNQSVQFRTPTPEPGRNGICSWTNCLSAGVATGRILRVIHRQLQFRGGDGHGSLNQGTDQSHRSCRRNGDLC